MLIPSVRADITAIPETDSHQLATECHDQHEVQAQHQHSADCAESCDCAAATCHANAALPQQNQALANSLLLAKLASFSEQIVSQSPSKFERPPRS